MQEQVSEQAGASVGTTWSLTQASDPAADPGLQEDIARLTEDIRRLQSEIADLRIQDRQRQALFVDVAEQREELLRQRANLEHEIRLLRGGGLLGPLQLFATQRPWLTRQVLRSAQVVWWTLTLKVHRRVPQMLRERRAALAATALRRATPQEPPPDPRSISAQIEAPLVAGVLKARFTALQPFPVYRAPGLPPRITLVTDSINSGSLYGGVATAIILAVELAKASGRRLRVLTRTDVAERENVNHVLKNAGIDYADSIEFCCSAPGSRIEVDVGENEIFLTTSWWTTYACRKIARSDRIIYLLQEDERGFYPAGDDQLRCAETLSDPRLHVVTNTKQLAEHLAAEGYDNIGRNGLSFDPAFPVASYRYEPSTARKRNFFFYARPMNLRNLFYRGLEAIGEAVEQGILDPAEWQVHFVGKDLDPKLANLPFRPILRENLAWADYTALVRRMDLGLSLMYTPHPSYPPLDLAASGAVVVTNRHGPKRDLDRFSKNIICADSDVASLVEALRAGTALACDTERRLANYRDSTFSRDWSGSLREVVATLSAQACS